MRVKLQEVCRNESSSLMLKQIQEEDGGYPVYGASGLIGYANFFHQDKPYVAVVKDGAGIGRTMLLPAKSSVIGTMQYLIPNDTILPEYLYFVVKNMRLERFFSGATIPHIYFKTYKHEQFNLVDIKNQKKVVFVLGKVEKLISDRERELALLDELVKSRFVELFGDPELNPMGWKQGIIRDAVVEVRYGTSRPAVDNGRYPYLRMNNITAEGNLDLTDIKRIDIPDSEIDKCSVRRGDVLFNRTNSRELVGKTCMYDRDDLMILAGFIIRIRTNDLMLPEFLSAFLNTDHSKRVLRGMCKNAIGQANINAQEMQNIGIYFPPLKRQERYVAFIARINKSKLDDCMEVAA